MKRLMMAGAMVLGISGLAWAATTAPATAPATQKAWADLPAPKQTIAAMMVAINIGDEAGVRATLTINKDQEESVDALLKLTAATTKLQAAADKAFGDEGAKAFGTVTADQTEARLKAIRDADLKIDGDSATVTIAEDPSLRHAGGTLKLKKIDGEWKLDAGSLFRLDSYKTAAELNNRVVLAKKLTTFTGMVTQEVAAGKFATAGEAYQSFMTRSLAIVKESQPATQPK